MKLRRTLLATAALLLVASLALAHDLFLKLDSYFVAPRTRVRIPVLNGTFSKSENFITPDRIADLSLVSPAGRTRPTRAAAWSRGPDSTSLLTVDVTDAGTYVAGASTRPRELSMSGADFNAYLEEDGIPDVLAARRAAGELEKGARERYSKHVKAVFQVGEARTNGFNTVLGYAAEIVPLDNPYAVTLPATLRIRCLVDGQPVSNQTVLWGGAGAERSIRTDAAGEAQLTLDATGKWYVKFVHMQRATDTAVDYESKWATLTFEVRGGS